MIEDVSFIFDTETNGFANCSVLSLSFIISQNGEILDEQTRYYFSKEKYNYHATKVHGLTEKVIKKNRDMCEYPLYFTDDKDWLINIMDQFKVKHLVAHNINFDKKFLPQEIIDQITDNKILPFCTMTENTTNVGIKKANKYKYPKLSEACQAYGIDFDDEEAHSSDYDTQKAYEFFIETIKRQ